MVSVQAILLFLLVLTQAPLPADATLLAPLPNLADAPPIWLILATIISTHVMLSLIVWIRTRTAIRLLHNSAVPAGAVSIGIDRLMNSARWATLVLTAIQIYGLKWSDVLTAMLGQTVLLKHILIIRSLILLVPPLLTWACFWASYHGVEKAIRQRSLPYRLAYGLPTHEMPACGQFVWMNLRHTCYLLVPIILASLVESVGIYVNQFWTHAETVLMAICFPLLLTFTPTLVTRFWDTAPLTGPLRERLDAIAKRHRLRYRDILIWKTHFTVTNAGFFGIVPFGRYLLLSDSLLESLDDQQIESVFAHEVGHGAHHHLWWHAAALAGFLALAVGLTGIASLWLPRTYALWGYDINVTDNLAMGLIVIGIGLGIPLISRRFEHQADWFAARHMAESLESAGVPTVALDPFFAAAPTLSEIMTLEQYAAAPPPADPPAVLPPAPPPTPAVPPIGLTPTAAQAIASAYLRLGANVFCQSLEALVDLTHRSRHRGGWMHPSPDRRILLLQRLSTDPQAVAAFNTRMILVRIAILGVLVAGILSIAVPELLAYLWQK